MAFSIDTHDLPTIRSFEQAKAKWESITPIRGRSENRRPLGKRSAIDSKWIEYYNHGEEMVVCGLHRTGVITYYKDRVEIWMAGWDSQSTTKFIRRVADLSCNAHNFGKYIPDGFNIKYNYADVIINCYPLSASNKHVFSYDGKLLSEPAEVYKYSVNRKRMNAIRKQYKSFYDYMQSMYNLVRDQEIELLWSRNSYNTTDLLNEEVRWDIFQEALQVGATNSKWYSNSSMRKIIDYNKMCRFIDSIIKADHPEALDSVRLTNVGSW